MDEKERNQFVDDLLEASLARYSSVTPRPGWEGRVLAHVKAAQQRRSWFVWAGWLAAGAAAALIVIGVFSQAHRRVTPAPPTSAGVPKTTTPPIVPHTPEVRQPKRSLVQERTSPGQAARPKSIVPRQEARLPVFPSPEPLTSEEKLLVQYVHATPAQVLLASSDETTKFQEIQFKELEISPLADEPADSKNNK